MEKLTMKDLNNRDLQNGVVLLTSEVRDTSEFNRVTVMTGQEVGYLRILKLIVTSGIVTIFIDKKHNIGRDKILETKEFFKDSKVKFIDCEISKNCSNSWCIPKDITPIVVEELEHCGTKIAEKEDNSSVKAYIYFIGRLYTITKDKEYEDVKVMYTDDPSAQDIQKAQSLDKESGRDIALQLKNLDECPTIYNALELGYYCEGYFNEVANYKFVTEIKAPYGNVVYLMNKEHNKLIRQVTTADNVSYHQVIETNMFLQVSSIIQALDLKSCDKLALKFLQPQNFKSLKGYADIVSIYGQTFKKDNSLDCTQLNLLCTLGDSITTINFYTYGTKLVARINGMHYVADTLSITMEDSLFLLFHNLLSKAEFLEENVKKAILNEAIRLANESQIIQDTFEGSNFIATPMDLKNIDTENILNGKSIGKYSHKDLCVYSLVAYDNNFYIIAYNYGMDIVLNILKITIKTATGMAIIELLQKLQFDNEDIVKIVDKVDKSVSNNIKKLKDLWTDNTIKNIFTDADISQLVGKDITVISSSDLEDSSIFEDIQYMSSVYIDSSFPVLIESILSQHAIPYEYININCKSSTVGRQAVVEQLL